MSVRRSGHSDTLPAPDGWDDIVVQALGIEGTLKNPGNGDRLTGAKTYEIANSLQHDEIAELIGYEYQHDVRETGTENNTEQGSAYSELQLAFGHDEERSYPGIDSLGFEDIKEDDTTGNDSDMEAFSAQDYDMLENTWLAYVPQFEDTGTSLAAGGYVSGPVHKQMWYRDLFGGGPVVTKHADIGIGQRMVCSNSISGQVRGEGLVQLYWTVHDADDIGLTVL